MTGKTDVMVAWAQIMFGFWLLSTTILFLINYRAHLPPEINRNIQQGFMLHVALTVIAFVGAYFIKRLLPAPLGGLTTEPSYYIVLLLIVIIWYLGFKYFVSSILFRVF